MEAQSGSEAERDFERARYALERDNTVAALAHLEKALRLNDNPCWYSFLGYCVAKERGQIRKGIDLCQTSLEHERENPKHYLHLGKIHLVSGNKAEAIRVFREGMATGGSDEIRRQLQEIGTRKPPVIRFLPRTSPVNKFLGKLLGRLGLR